MDFFILSSWTELSGRLDRIVLNRWTELSAIRSNTGQFCPVIEDKIVRYLLRFRTILSGIWRVLLCWLRTILPGVRVSISLKLFDPVPPNE